jgi:gamma-glutamyltranspeptidase/glutathione hydrolase
MNMAAPAGLKAMGHWSTSPEAFRAINAISNAAMMSAVPAEYRPESLRDADFSLANRRTPAHAEALWAALDPSASLAQGGGGAKSDTVTVIDSEGNISALCHSSNCMCWGATTLIVDGVSIHDPASHSSAMAIGRTPGDYLPAPLEVGVMLKGGEGVVGFASKNMGLHQKTVQCLINMTEFGMDAVEAANAPALGLPAFDEGDPVVKPRVVDGDFPDDVLKRSGLPVEVAPKDLAWVAEGHWVPAQRDPQTGHLSATSPEHASGQAAGY